MPSTRRLIRTTIVAVSALAVAGIGTAVQAAALGPDPAGAVPIPEAREHRQQSTGTAGDRAQTAGARLPFVEYEAEQGDTNGGAVGPDYTQGTVASEASGRQAVELSGAGDYVQFTLDEPANAMTVAYNVPDGKEGTLSVHVNGTELEQPLPVTSEYSYVDTPWIAGSETHHLFDHARMQLGSDLAAGDTVRLEVGADDSAGPYVIDLAQFEQVGPAAEKPADAISVEQNGADPGGDQDSTEAFRTTIEQAASQGVEVWIPPGDFRLDSSLSVDEVTIRGAGAWHSVVRSSRFIDQPEATGNIGLHDFAVIGEVTERVDSNPDNFVNGSLGTGSHVSGMWLQHLKVGLWLVGTNVDLIVEDSRFLDLTADGLNLNGSATGVVVRNNYLRNTGDDSLAMWALNETNTEDAFVGNTIVQPNLANGIAIYGGTDITVRDNEIRDANALGSGIAISNQKFLDPFFPLAGTITVADNTLIRTGAMNPNWDHPMGALRVDAYDHPIDATVSISGTTAIDSPYSVFEFVSGGGTGLPVRNVEVNGATVEGAGTVVVQAETVGSARFTDVQARDVGVAGVYNCPFPQSDGTFDVERVSGNSGWDSVWDGCEFPDPE